MASKGESCDKSECPICFEQITCPNILPCNHTFCRLCLKSYISPQQDGRGKNDTTFPCPVCRQFVTLPQDALTVADTLSDSPVITPVIDERSKVNEDVDEVLCGPCSRDEKKMVAVSWCTSCCEKLCDKCVTYHKLFKQSNHVMVPIDDTVSNEKLSDILDVELCMTHNGKVVEVYCVDHKVLCCVICLATQHRKCERISTLDDMVSGDVDADTSEYISQSLSEVVKVAEGLTLKTEENSGELDNSHSKICKDVATIVQQAKDKLDDLHSVFTSTFQNKHQAESSKMSKRQKSIELFLRNVKKGQALLQTVREHGSPKQIFTTNEKLKMKMTDHLKCLTNDLEGDECVGYTCSQSNALLSMVNSLTTIAQVDIQTNNESKQMLDTIFKLVDNLSEEKSEHSERIKPCEVDIMNLKVSKIGFIRFGNVRIVGGTYLPDGRIVFCNFDDFKLQICDGMGSHLFETSCKRRPLDACVVSSCEIIVSFHSGFDVWSLYLAKIGRYEITEDAIIEKRRIECSLSDPPHGLASNRINEIVAAKYEEQIDILSLDGELIRSLSCKYFGRWTYVAISQTGNVYYLEGENIVCKNVENKEILRFTHPTFKSGVGIAVDKYENVYVCESRSNRVRIFSPDGKKTKILTETTGHVFQPYKIGFNKEESMFFVSGGTAVEIYTCCFT